MNSSETITINSGHVADAIDSQLIMLVKTLQVENRASFEDALETGRNFLIKKHVELMNDADKNNIKSIAESIKQRFKDNPNDQASKDAYNICKYFGLYNYLT